MSNDQERPHRRSIRLQQFDYSHGWFVVTICTANRAETLGRAHGDLVELSALGRICEECWLAIPDHLARASLDAFVIMPNHLHGIVALSDEGTACRAPAVEAFRAPTKSSLPTLVRSFKAAVSKRANDSLQGTRSSVWQRGYFERAIRDERELDRFRRYIEANPARWAEDKENPRIR